jgi:hypothetical protein
VKETPVHHPFIPAASVPVDLADARLHEEGRQSWSPSGAYALCDRPYRPANGNRATVCYRPGVTSAEGAFQGEGLLFDAMRVSPDTAPHRRAEGDDYSQPGQDAAEFMRVGRQWQHGRLWVDDPDCLMARPAVETRERWAAHVEATGGLRASSDRLLSLDRWGVETTTRRLLSGGAR